MSIQSETFNTRSMDLTNELLQGAIDIHVHAGPHLKSSPRRVDPFEAAEEARAAGMRAIVYMDVFFESCGTAWMVQRQVPGIEVYGGINLNSNYGGINPLELRRNQSARTTEESIREPSRQRFTTARAQNSCSLAPIRRTSWLPARPKSRMENQSYSRTFIRSSWTKNSPVPSGYP